MATHEELEQQVRDSAPLAERLIDCCKRIGLICSDGRPPRMRVPVEWNDDDFFISVTLKDALLDVRRLDSGVIRTMDRDESGTIRSGIDLRRAIDTAIVYLAP